MNNIVKESLMNNKAQRFFMFLGQVLWNAYGLTIHTISIHIDGVFRTRFFPAEGHLLETLIFFEISYGSYQTFDYLP